MDQMLPCTCAEPVNLGQSNRKLYKPMSHVIKKCISLETPAQCLTFQGMVQLLLFTQVGC